MPQFAYFAIISRMESQTYFTSSSFMPAYDGKLTPYFERRALEGKFPSSLYGGITCRG
jgi:hypothetical protein